MGKDKSTEKYDVIGVNYNQTRKADNYLVSRLVYYLDPIDEKKYLDIGSGTGNYTIAVNNYGGEFVGVEPSEKMLTQAKAKSDRINWVKGNAEAIPLGDESIDGAMATLTLHHWQDLQQGLKEVYRVLKPGSNFVVFTSDPDQMRSYWVNHYFPKMLADSIAQMPSVTLVKDGLANAGFSDITIEKYFVKDDLQDLFLQAGKNRPWLYLKPEVRAGISSFADLSNAEEVRKGLIKLEEDIKSGKLEEIRKKYESDMGDYMFIKAVR